MKCKEVFFHAQRHTNAFHHKDAKQETRILDINAAFDLKRKQEVRARNCIIFKNMAASMKACVLLATI